MARSVGRGTTGRRGHAYTQHGTLRGRIGIARFAFGRGAAAPAVRAPAPLRVGRTGRFPVRAPTSNESAVCAPAAARAPPPPRPLSPRLCRVSVSLVSLSVSLAARRAARHLPASRSRARGRLARLSRGSIDRRRRRASVDVVSRGPPRPAAGAASRGERGVAQPQAAGRPGRPLGARSTIAAEIKRLMLKNKACKNTHTPTCEQCTRVLPGSGFKKGCATYYDGCTETSLRQNGALLI